jgi:hypothetical protein
LGTEADGQTVINSILTALHDTAVSTSTAYFLEYKSLELGTVRNRINLGAIRGEERLRSEFSEDILYECGTAVSLSFRLVWDTYNVFQEWGGKYNYFLNLVSVTSKFKYFFDNG